MPTLPSTLFRQIDSPKGHHPRNRHRGRYDFAQLIKASPALASFIVPHPDGGETVDFFDPAAVSALNAALLKNDYAFGAWSVPPGYLSPPIPGRADYIHHLADLLAEDAQGTIPRGPGVKIFDIGVGANCVYPIIGQGEYNWSFVGTDIDRKAIAWAARLAAGNPVLARQIDCRFQPSSAEMFAGVIKPEEIFAASMCNPPFHASAEEAAAGTLRKLRNLSDAAIDKPVLNFGGRSNELWCPGGESAFVRRMIAQSAKLPGTCLWFSTFISKASNLPAVHNALRSARAAEVRTIDMAYGQKKSRIVAWTFLRPEARRNWIAKHLRPAA